MEMERLIRKIQEQILEAHQVEGFRAGKFSLWLKFVRFVSYDGSRMEEQVAPVHKVILKAISSHELVEEVAENMVLMVYGAEIPVVAHMPNLIVKLLNHKVYVPMEGAPPIDQEGQIFLKATVYVLEPSLWDQLFGRKEQDSES